ncbi:MAG TPA: hypothetical protein VJ812_16800 [Gemmatimonadaceae bacterium]|jgi:hypothetical protein|nr:hypothetical protein [Gemmatimonadaceae bacterium]
MSHLDTERLAMLADDEPSAAEREHLIECEHCAREWRGYVALRGMAAQAPSEMTMTPLTTWDVLAAQLRDEGLIRGGGAGGQSTVVRSGGRWMRGWMQIAASLLLLAGGAVAGRMSVQADGGGAQSAVGSRPTAVSGAQLTAGSADSSFASVEDARAVLEQAERQYRLASLWLLERQDSTDTGSNPELYRTRLAALDQMAGAAREAVYDAPHDPVINSYYINTLAAREVTLKQLNASLGGQVNRF